MGFDHQFGLVSTTGAELNLYVRKTDRPARGVVQINHGLAEHAARYARFADYLAGRGYHSYAHDHRGHGHTKAQDAPLGRFAAANGDAQVVADIAAVHDRIAEDHPGLPVIVFGHSMGGLVATSFLIRHSDRAHAAAIWNANFSADVMGRVAQAVLAWERFRLGSDVPSRVLPRLTFQDWGRKVPGHRTPFDWLSRDPAEVEKYIADPLCGWDASVSMWLDVFRFVFAGADDRNFSRIRRDLPINLVGGEHDPGSDGGKAITAFAKRLERMGFSNLVSRIYPQTRHESLNELNRDIIMADFADWLDKVCRPEATGSEPGRLSGSAGA
ncbi:alpha/beta fold hydrolase [Arvimicrobium flavum]|uniref:alpha/beta fold hydrolase n=1 Tax=Arvimicrobium flavum TaxID=3393320 RepID=UPI00237B222D|nr:alpha/beta hydrolase [Mesorhizobium shangrilense]